MSHPSRTPTHSGRWTSPAPSSWRDVLRTDWAIAWAWATAPLKRLYNAAMREGVSPPTAFDNLPPGEFPPIDAIRDELFGRPRDRRGPAHRPPGVEWPRTGENI